MDVRCWSFALFLVSLTAFTVILVCGETGDEWSSEKVQDLCVNGNVTHLNATSGSLKVKDLTEKDLRCHWIINITNTTNTPVHFDVHALTLLSGDEFTISYKNETVYSLNGGHLEPTVILTGINSGDLDVYLNIGSQKGARSFAMDFNYVANESTFFVTEKNRKGFFTLPTYNATKSPPVPEIQKFVFVFELQQPLTEEYKLVVGFNDVTINGTVEIDGVQDFSGVYKSATPDLIADDNQIKISLKSFSLTSPKNGRMQLYYTLFDKDCAKYVTDSGNRSISVSSLAPEKFTRPVMSCLFIATNSKNNAKYLLDYSQWNFMNNMDSLTVRTGNRRTSPVLAVVNKQNKGNLQNTFADTLSMGSELHITYNCPFGILSEYKASTLTATSFMDGGYFTQPTTVVLDGTKNTIPIQFLFEGKPANQAVFETKGTQTLKDGYLKIYDSDEVTDDPIFVFNKGDTLPETITSPTHVLRLEFEKNLKDFAGSFNETQHAKSSIANEDTSSIVVSHLNCSDSYSWLIPSKKKNGNDTNNDVLSLQIRYLFLNSSSDSLTLTELRKNSVLSIVGTDSGDVKSKTLPNFLLFGNVSYMLTYTRGAKNCDSKVLLGVVFQASFVFNPLKGYENQMKLIANEKVTITTDSYPNYYALRENSLNNECLKSVPGCGWQVVPAFNTSGKDDKPLLVTVVNFDLAPNDVVKMNSIEIKANEALPVDNIYNNVTVQLSSSFAKEVKLTEQLSGKGYKINITSFDCGKLFDKSQSFSVAKGAKSQKCIYIVDESKSGKEVNQTLNFTVKFTDEGNKGKLLIYDTPTLRYPRVIEVNSSMPNIPGSVNRTLIVYDTVGIKDAAGIEVSWRFNKCDEWCRNGVRCVLRSFRCDGTDDCGDWTDELKCNRTLPCPKPPNPPKTGGGKVNGYVIVFVIIPLAIIVGVLITKFGPNVIRRFRGTSYQEFRDYADS